MTSPHYGYLAIFFGLSLESTVVVGLVFPGIGILVTSGYLAGIGELDALAVFSAAGLGVLAGDNIGYLLGKYGLVRFRWIQRIANPYHNRQLRWRLLVFFQFAMPTRTATPVVVGALRIPFYRWFPLNLIATAIFVGSVGGLGYAVGRITGDLSSAQSWAARLQIIFVLLLVVWSVYFAIRWRRHRRRAEDQMRVVSTAERNGTSHNSHGGSEGSAQDEP
ncbi:MAG: hypothetical protein QOG53_3519 [Frankiales bacterium]|jgi:membrane protein DedA with SNARE-associated domain|nr:hypothetical protein [Frankiales bacterium]